MYWLAGYWGAMYWGAQKGDARHETDNLIFSSPG